MGNIREKEMIAAKICISVLIVCLVAGCAKFTEADQVNKAIELCSTNYGLKAFRNDWAFGMWIRCNNGAEFYL
ncbi:MAG: hypothetical protein CL946_04730 [Ectothiorhodospiraceae bacterium]|jgi:hypothetical protein|nr:hypothetical protein [Ectothiorhodospiraceae bacterium]